MGLDRFAAHLMRHRPAISLSALLMACAGVALFAWMLRGDLNALDSEHVFAFALGAAVAGRVVLGTVRRSDSPMRPHGVG